MPTRISAKKIANSQIDGYNVRAYDLGYNSFYGMDFVCIPEWKYVLLVYQNKTNFADVMVEIREMDESGNTKQFAPELFKSVLPSSMENNYYELNGVPYLRSTKNGIYKIPSTINMDLVYSSCGYGFALSCGKHLQIAKKWSNTVHTYEEADEVYQLFRVIHEFKYQITTTGSLNTKIDKYERSISKMMNEISECDEAIRTIYMEYNKSKQLIESYGIDSKQFEIE